MIFERDSRLSFSFKNLKSGPSRTWTWPLNKIFFQKKFLFRSSPSRIVYLTFISWRIEIMLPEPQSPRTGLALSDLQSTSSGGTYAIGGGGISGLAISSSHGSGSWSTRGVGGIGGGLFDNSSSSSSGGSGSSKVRLSFILFYSHKNTLKIVVHFSTIFVNNQKGDNQI